MNGPDTIFQPVSRDVFSEQPVTDFLGLDTGQLRTLTERPKNRQANRSDARAQIERLLHRPRFLQRVPCGSSVVQSVAVSGSPLENPVRPDQTRNKEFLAHLLLKR